MYDAALQEVAHVLDKGDEVWSYNCLQQDDYSPKWLLDFAPINFRIQPGFINQSLGLTGLLYWRVDDWRHDPWTNPTGYLDFPGEGLFLYPGEPAGVSGVVPSLRLKWLRDGVDDYDYIEILKQQGFGEWAMPMVRGVGPDWSHWTRDPGALEAARQQLGWRLDGSFEEIIFIDVLPSFWAFEEINACYAAGIVAGYNNRTYRPLLPITRDQMAVYISRGVAGGEAYVPTGPAEPTFEDVPISQWAYKYIEYVYEKNIVTGYPRGQYRPARQVDRGQMAVFMARASADPTGDEGLVAYQPPMDPTYRDVPRMSWVYRYVEYLTDQEVVHGYSNGTYRPFKIVTRDQLAVYMTRAFALEAGG